MESCVLSGIRYNLCLPRERREMEQSPFEEETASRATSTPLTRAGTASLFLARLKIKHSLSQKRDDNQVEDNPAECVPPPPPPPSRIPESPIISMQDYFAISERACSEEVNRTSLLINEDFIRRILSEHRKQLGCRSQIWQHLELGKPHEAETALAATRSGEINGLLLQACFEGRTDLIRRLQKRGADVNYVEPGYGLTPLHLCAFRNCVDGVKYLLEQGACLGTSWKHTAFHYAAFGDAFEVAQYLLQQGISEVSPPDSKETVLHVAARTNALRVLFLLAPNSRELDRLDQDGYAAIHHAATGNSICLDILLKAGCQVDLPTRKKDTALHLAAEGGYSDNLTLLVEANANLQPKNHRGHTALHLAARSHSVECMEILLKGRADPNEEDDEGRTPLHLALGKSLMTDDVTELLLKWKANVNKADKYGYTPLHIAASNELSRCVNLLIKYEADLSARTIGGNSALSIVLRKTPTSLDVFERRLDASLSLSRQGFVGGELELQLDFRPLLNRQNRHVRSPEISYLNTFVKEGYKEILEHPLCQSFLHLKWHKIRKYYAARLLFYLIYVLILTTWVITALAHNCYNDSHHVAQNYTNESVLHVDGNETHTRKTINRTYLNGTLCANATGIYSFFYSHPTVLEVQWYVLVALTVLEALRKFIVIPSYRSVKQFFMQMENLVEWCVILSVFAISFVYTGRTYIWQSQLGALAVLCGWSNLMLMIGQLPVFGAYVAMFTSVQAQVFKLLLAYACLLIGFTASFCVIFPHSKSFSSIHTGLIKVLAMMTGELNFDDLFFSIDKGGAFDDAGGVPWILLKISAHISFVLFLLFVTIVLMNLLIGIAVHDIKGLQKTAGLAKLVRQTKLIHDVEIAVFVGFMPSKRFIKYLRWIALLLPSPLRAVLTVRPLNPRERRLPRDVLSAAYKIAKEGDGQSTGFAVARKKSYGPAYYTKACLKADVTACRRRAYDEDTLVHDCNRYKDDIAELKELCEKNHTLLRELVKIHGTR